MPTRGAFNAVDRTGVLAGAFASVRISKPSTALFQISGLVLTSAKGISPLVRLTFAPALRSRFTKSAEVAPLYGKRHVFAPPLATASTNLGVAATFSKVSVPGSGLFANSVLTPNCIPSDHADTSYGASAGAFGARRTS